MSLGPLKVAVGLVGILQAAAGGPRSTHELVETLRDLGVDVTGPELYPWLRKLTQENLVTPSLLLDPNGAQLRHYWITREGARALDHALQILRVMEGSRASGA